MKSKRSQFMIWSLFAWLVWVLTYAVIMDWEVKDINFIISLFSSASFYFPFLIISIGIWHICRKIPFERFPKIIFGLIHYLLALLVSGLWLFLAYGGWYLAAGDVVFEMVNFYQIIGWQFLFGIVQYVLVISISYTVIYYRNLKQIQLAEVELKVLMRDAELKALKLQMNPHFLFNTLNSVSALVTENPQGARTMIARLSELLRMSLEHHDELIVPLETELEFARTYISIEQIRFGNRMKYNEDIEDGLQTWPVPSMVFQPLLENAVKYGIANNIKGGDIRLQVKHQDSKLVCKITNPIAPTYSDVDSTSTGTGLENIRQRFARLYGDSYIMETQFSSGNEFEIVLILPGMR
ncbi:histidine kinase [candidate division KSB1 bacterium]|nr:histidine kinase [candidate division KSB1 bacterium]